MDANPGSDICVRDPQASPQGKERTLAAPLNGGGSHSARLEAVYARAKLPDWNMQNLCWHKTQPSPPLFAEKMLSK